VGVIKAIVAVFQRPKYHERPAKAAKHDNVAMETTGALAALAQVLVEKIP